MPNPDPSPRSPAAVVPPWTTGSIVALLAITAAGGLLRLWRLELWSLGPAEAANWAGAVRLAVDGLPASHAFSRGFLGLLLATGILPGQGEGWLRLPFAFVGMITVPLLAFALARAGGRGPALLAAALLAVHPSHLRWSQTADDFVIAAFVAALAAAAAAWLGRRGAPLWGGLVLVASWLAASHDDLGGGVLARLAWPLVTLAAACGLWAAGQRAVVTPLLLCAAPGLVGVALAPFGLGSGLAAAALPPLCLLAALGCVALWRGLRVQVLAWQALALPWTVAVVALAPTAWLFAGLGVDSYLLLTARRGERSDVRAAANLLLDAAVRQPIAVAAAAHLPALAYYLQPLLRGGRVVLVPNGRPLPAGGAAFVVTHAEDADVAVLLDEPELLLVVPGPGAHVDRTVEVWGPRQQP